MTNSAHLTFQPFRFSAFSESFESAETMSSPISWIVASIDSEFALMS